MNGETIVLTQRAQQQLMILNALERGDLLMAQAADLLGLSVRQVRRLRAAYRQRGPHALIHGNRGRRSPRRVDEATRTRVIRLARTTYAGVNHQHLTELLAEREGLTLSHPTIHRILRGAGVPSPRRRRPPRHRRRRERLPQAGMLVPQAKGRIERLFGTFQDRLRGELRLAGVAERDGANAFLVEFLMRYNARFTHAAAIPTSAFRPWPSGLDPDAVFCFKYRRIVANDNTVTLGPHLVQILAGPQGRSYAKAHVEVHEHLDGTLSVVYQGQPLAIHLLTPPSQDRLLRVRARKRRPNPPSATRRQDQLRQRPRSKDSKPRPRQPGKPRADHPWNQYALMEKKRKALKEAGVSFSLNR